MKLVSEVYLFEMLDRPTFKAKNNGVQAPPFDPTKAIKRWSTVIDKPTAWPVADSTSPTGVTERIFSVAEAAFLNLTGPYEYAPTPYVMPSPWYNVKPEYVAKLVELINQGGHNKAEAVINSSVGMAAPVSWPEIKIDGVPIYAAYLVPTWFSIGKDRKGTWSVQGSSLVFAPAVETVIPGTTPREDTQIPLHPLADGEVIVFGAAGGMGAPVIETAADRQAAGGGSTATGAGGYTVQDRFRDNSTADAVMQLLSILQGGPK